MSESIHCLIQKKTTTAKHRWVFISHVCGSSHPVLAMRLLFLFLFYSVCPFQHSALHSAVYNVTEVSCWELNLLSDYVFYSTLLLFNKHSFSELTELQLAISEFYIVITRAIRFNFICHIFNRFATITLLFAPSMLISL